MDRNPSKAPWVPVSAPNGHIYVKDREGTVIATVAGNNALANGNAFANATILASGPELLQRATQLQEALRYLVQQAKLSDLGERNRALHNAEHVLSKGQLSTGLWIDA